MTVDEIDRVLFVGAGQMGCANSVVAAVSGYEVVLFDRSPAALDSVGAVHRELGAFLVGAGYCTAEALDAAQHRVSLAADLDGALAGVDLVSESIVEDLVVKRDLFAQLDDRSDATTLLTTNTSALLVSDIEDVLARGERFAALHSHLGSLLFDIVGGPRTAPATIDVLQRYVLSLGGVPLVLNKEHRGYVFNAINGPILASALALVADGLADVEATDRAWMTDRKAPMGPFGMIDLFGIDLVLTAWRQPSDDLRRESLRARVAPLLERYVDRGDLGRKTGRGFYRYPAPAFDDPGFLESEPVNRVAADALTTTLICGAARLAMADVASRPDIDMAWCAATGLDAGPFAIAAELGPAQLGQMLELQVGLGLIAADEAEHVLDVLR